MTIVQKPVFRDLIPPLAEEEFSLLEENIRRDGCREPLVVWRPAQMIQIDGAYLIDGHNRYKICIKHGIPFETVEMEFADEPAAREWIIKNQNGRRNLKESQRAMLAVELEKIYAERARLRMISTQNNDTAKAATANLPEQGEKGESREHAARDMSVSPRSVSMAKKVEEHCIPRVSDMVKRGELAVSAAEAIAELSVQEQGKLVEKGKEAIVQKAGEIRKEKKEEKKREEAGPKVAQDIPIWMLTPLNALAKKILRNESMLTQVEIERLFK